MSPTRPSADSSCALHSQRLDRLEEGQSEILEALNGTLQAPGLLSQLALLRQSVEDLRRDLKEERESKALPNRAQVLAIVLAALLSVAGTMATMKLTATPPAQAAQTSAQGH